MSALYGNANVPGVRLKVYCSTKLFSAPQGGTTNSASFTLYPVTYGSEENKQFFANTPSGKLEFGVVNLPAASFFEPGIEYYVDITPANAYIMTAPADGGESDPNA